MAQFYDGVYKTVKQIPFGKVSSYGRIAVMVGKPRAARAVGYALNALSKDSEQDVPWHRVINSQGRISFRGDNLRAELQKELLISEGIKFTNNDSIDWDLFGWP